MKKQYYLVVIVFAIVIGLFGTPNKARADAITVGSAQVNTDGQGMKYVLGKGTFSVDTGRVLLGINMLVKKLSDGTLVSTTPATVVQTEWASNSTHNLISGTTYIVTAEIKTTDTNGGDLRITPSMNSVQVTP